MGAGDARDRGRASDDRGTFVRMGRVSGAVVCSCRYVTSRGRSARYVKVMRDLTERKLMEDELRARAEALRESDRRKNEFLAVLSHELRNPLAPILTSLYVLKTQNRTDEPLLQQSHAMIERQVRNLKRLIDDLLDVSRMALNRIELRRERWISRSLQHGPPRTFVRSCWSGNTS